MDVTLPDCQNMQVSREIMAAVVRVESAGNPFAIGVVGGRLSRQPKNISEAVATIKDLESRGYNYSVGLAQVNKTNFAKYGLNTFEQAFDTCTNLVAGSTILRECFSRTNNDWGKAFSCYYSGNFITGFNHGYVKKVTDSYFAAPSQNTTPSPISVIPGIQNTSFANPSLAVTRVAHRTATDIPAFSRNYGGTVVIQDDTAPDLSRQAISRFTNVSANDNALQAGESAMSDVVATRAVPARLQKQQAADTTESQERQLLPVKVPFEQNIQTSTDAARVF